MELKIKQIELKLEQQDGEIMALKETHKEFLTALDVLQQMVEDDSIEIKKLLTLIGNRETKTRILPIGEKQLSVL